MAYQGDTINSANATSNKRTLTIPLDMRGIQTLVNTLVQLRDDTGATSATIDILAHGQAREVAVHHGDENATTTATAATALDTGSVPKQQTATVSIAARPPTASAVSGVNASCTVLSSSVRLIEAVEAGSGGRVRRGPPGFNPSDLIADTSEWGDFSFETELLAARRSAPAPSVSTSMQDAGASRVNAEEEDGEEDGGSLI